MPTNGAVLLARPDQQAGVALGTGDLEEFDALLGDHVLNKKRVSDPACSRRNDYLSAHGVIRDFRKETGYHLQRFV